KSFHALLQHEEADYYFFSDQVDIWLPEKLERSLAETTNYPEDLPLMVYMDLTVVDQDLQVMAKSMIRSQSGQANTELVE
ncbi:glycosyltransferase family 2 protein, partial [Streptococcus pyogenes]